MKAKEILWNLKMAERKFLSFITEELQPESARWIQYAGASPEPFKKCGILLHFKSSQNSLKFSISAGSSFVDKENPVAIFDFHADFIYNYFEDVKYNALKK